MRDFVIIVRSKRIKFGILHESKTEFVRSHYIIQTQMGKYMRRSMYACDV